MTGGRCHGPDCTQPAVVEFWCSEACKLTWDRQAAGLPAPAPVTPLTVDGVARPMRLAEVSIVEPRRGTGWVAAAVEEARPEVERAFNEAIDQALADIRTEPAPQLVHGPPGSLVEDIYRAYEMVRDVPTPEPVKLTRAQIDALRREQTPSRPWGALEPLVGVPIELVDSVEESTPYLHELAAFAHASHENRLIAESAQVALPNPQVGFLGRAFHWLFGRTS